jgi:hypothetical protein
MTNNIGLTFNVGDTILHSTKKVLSKTISISDTKYHIHVVSMSIACLLATWSYMSGWSAKKHVHKYAPVLRKAQIKNDLSNFTLDHSIVQTHSSMLWAEQYYMEYSSHSSRVWEIFRIMLSIPRNIACYESQQCYRSCKLCLCWSFVGSIRPVFAKSTIFLLQSYWHFYQSKIWKKKQKKALKINTLRRHHLKSIELAPTAQ